ncbi:MAG: ABC transporter permease [Actinomycetes bacterium]|jgi:putative ABC transport system permease protein|nr:ABC transporter permease [Actinomycetes bacterium]
MIRNIMLSTLLGLRTHKLRVVLTMVGIIIGIASVITITALGEGVKKNSMDLLDSTGVSGITMVYLPDKIEDMGLDFSFKKSDMKRLLRLESVASIIPNYGYFMGIGDGEVIDAATTYLGTDGSISVTGRAAGAAADELSLGRAITDADGESHVVVLDYMTAQSLAVDGIQMRDLLDTGISIGGAMFRIIGIKADPTELSAADADWTQHCATLPFAAFQQLIADEPIYSLVLTPAAGYERQTVIDQATDVLTQAHPGLAGTFEVDDSIASMRAEMESSLNIAIVVFVSITVIALLVGGIGVMNIMYVSVTERRREIGIKRAIGAKPRVILLQFLFEAVFITFIGGVLGVLFGFALAKAAAFAINTMVPDVEGMFGAILSVKMTAIACATSAGIGLIFGIVPAIGAARTDPIKAIYQ